MPNTFFQLRDISYTDKDLTDHANFYLEDVAEGLGVDYMEALSMLNIEDLSFIRDEEGTHVIVDTAGVYTLIEYYSHEPNTKDFRQFFKAQLADTVYIPLEGVKYE